MEKAVIDRIEDGWATLLVGEREQEVTVPVDELPPKAGEGVWLQLELDGSRVVQIQIDSEETARVHGRVKDKMERLRARGRKR